jgi:ADP-ribosyl-[dinitrogen reductase] hydrolase
VIEAVNQGGDADTAGALAAMLARATYGLAAVPKKWINKLDRTIAAEVRQQVPDLLAIPAAGRAPASGPAPAFPI